MDDGQKSFLCPSSISVHYYSYMDGNGRWAQKRFLPRAMGHRQGAQALDKLTKEAEGLGVEYITVYAFSTENWKRSKDEVDSIMGLLREYINRFFNDKKSILKIRSAGDLTALSPDLQADIEKLKEQSKDRPGMTLTIAINYGGRDEIRRAVTKIAEDVKAGKIQPEDINDQMISDNLDTAGIPDPELIIRTSGEFRTSNFLMWQSAYSEYYITDKLWPDFNVEDLKDAIKAYQTRDRRFGGRKEG